MATVRDAEDDFNTVVIDLNPADDGMDDLTHAQPVEPDPVAMVAARLLMRYWLISGSTSLAKFRNDSCHPR